MDNNELRKEAKRMAERNADGYCKDDINSLIEKELGLSHHKLYYTDATVSKYHLTRYLLGIKRLKEKHKIK